jgi:succinate dehydrogenase/fumarate reductase flavoprotein subunit
MNDKHEDESSSNFLTRTTIREANNHLQMLHKHNKELEELVNQQNEELRRKDHEYMNLFRANQLLEKHYQQLQVLLDDRTRRLHAYEKKEVLFRETLELKPAIESLLDLLNTFEKEDTTLCNNLLQFKKKTIDVDHKTDDV